MNNIMNGWSASEWTGWESGGKAYNLHKMSGISQTLSLSLAIGKKYKVIYLNRKDLHYWRNETN